jgi:signal peptidase I
VGIIRRLYYSGSCFFELGGGVIFTAVAVMVIHLFVATIFIVDGSSMQPNFATGQVIIVNRWTYLFGSPERGDVTVLRFPGDPEHKKYVKRLIGLPGETVEIRAERIYVNDTQLAEPYLAREETTPVSIPGKTRWVDRESEYFFMGDNRHNSNDSRTWDQADKRFLIGKAVFILWPPKDAGFVPKETYGI